MGRKEVRVILHELLIKKLEHFAAKEQISVENLIAIYTYHSIIKHDEIMKFERMIEEVKKNE